MPLTIALAALKGGVGKSTIAVNLAAGLHKSGHRVLLVDADSQGTCRTWSARAAELAEDGPPVVGMNGNSLRRDLNGVSKPFDVIVIDSPSRMGAEARAAMLAADLVVTPVIPGAPDVWALQETLAVLEEARGFRPELRAVVVLNRSAHTTLARLAQKALDELKVEVLSTKLGNRVAFGEAILAGQGVIDYAPNSVAAAEMVGLTRAILGAIDGKKARTSNNRLRSAKAAAPNGRARTNGAHVRGGQAQKRRRRGRLAEKAARAG